MKTILRVNFIVALAIAFAVSGLAQERFVKPVDGAKKDASFVTFRDRLIKAAEARDTKFVVSIMDPKIQLSFGGDSGIADFRKVWKPDSKDSDFWKELLLVLRNGGDFDKKEFTAPYTFSSWPDDLDAFEYFAILGNNVNLREAGSPDATVIGSLSYNVVKVDHDRSVVRNKGTEKEYYEWLWVTTLGGKSGFVKSEFVRSNIDFRAGFAKKRGLWKMTFFLAGD